MDSYGYLEQPKLRDTQRSADAWMNKMWFIFTVSYSSVKESKEVLTHSFNMDNPPKTSC